MVPAVAGYMVSAAAELQLYDLNLIGPMVMNRVRARFETHKDFENAARTRRAERMG